MTKLSVIVMSGLFNFSFLLSFVGVIISDIEYLFEMRGSKCKIQIKIKPTAK